VPLLPATINTGQSLKFSVVFAPGQSGQYSGTFRIDLSGRSLSGTLSASTTISSLSLAYIEPDTNNVLSLRDGSTLLFPATTVGTTSTVTLLVNNNGAGTAQIDSIAISSSVPAAFQLINVPALPAATPPNQQVRFAVRFSPLQPQAFSGSVAISIN